MLIQGGTVVDGTGAAGYRADVRINDGLITEIALDLDPHGTEQVVDASGCTVCPGFIESHTHFDGAMWWDGTLDPLPGYGVTTCIMGNCGFSVAPVHDEEAVRREVVGIFSFFEDIPVAPFLSELPWDWRTWPEYKASMVHHVKSTTNYAAFVGHIAIRLAVLGMEAWKRAANTEEIRRMASLLDDALQAGAIGMSSNLMDHDGDDRPVPSLLADDAEWRALMDVIARYPGKSLQVIVDNFRTMQSPQQVAHLAELAGDLPLRMQWGGLPTLQFQKDIGIQEPLAQLHEQFKRSGKDFWTGYAHVPVTATLSVNRSLLFAQANDYVWHEVVLLESEEEKITLMRDPEWRRRARHSWDNEAFDFSPLRKNPRDMTLINSDNGIGPIRITLGEYQDQIGAPHPSDAMADWLIANGLQSTVTMAPFLKDEETLEKLLKDPMAVGNISDAGAHGQMLCGGGENIKLFTHFVRETGQLTLEEAVHIQTGRLARHFALHDRGEISVGKCADITVFNLDEIEHREMEKIYDVPDGKGGYIWRWTREPAPVRLTLVNGVATFAEGSATGALPGEFVTGRFCTIE
ncbi:MAG: N-acyl-D-amino-acid deacylase family protein [Pseudomonadales bacterium]